MDQEVDHVDKLFVGFIKHVDAFRLLMLKYRALVAGSSVLRLFVEYEILRVGGQVQAWAPSDLDVYVSRHLLGAAGLVDWHVHLTRVQGMKLDWQQDRHSDVS